VFSKIASSPVKLAEYLAVGLPVVINQGIGDSQVLSREPVVVDARTMTRDELELAAAEIVALPPRAQSLPIARQLAQRHFDLVEVGAARYQRLYERLSS
jgi:glycosyltransferase involved in cell wall biosynthesis